MKENEQLSDQIRIALALVPDGEMLGSIEASNNVHVERQVLGRKTWPIAGMMEVVVTTYLPNGVERTYQVIREGTTAVLHMMSEIPPYPVPHYDHE